MWSHVIWGIGNYRFILRFTVKERRIWTVTVWPCGTQRSACRKVRFLLNLVTFLHCISNSYSEPSSRVTNRSSSQTNTARLIRVYLVMIVSHWLQVRCLETGISSLDSVCLWTRIPMRRNFWRYRNKSLFYQWRYSIYLCAVLRTILHKHICWRTVIYIMCQEEISDYIYKDPLSLFVIIQWDLCSRPHRDSISP